ncbi:unnamed protein product [Allacma fusca]|uniref:Insulin receptor substrate 1 n=1 Tax=Allacma fusca TaxID=39272 RepID=A0A8J2PTL4_9HEXA|nr:unnamed protein product [Allacma fusca]
MSVTNDEVSSISGGGSGNCTTTSSTTTSTTPTTPANTGNNTTGSAGSSSLSSSTNTISSPTGGNGQGTDFPNPTSNMEDDVVKSGYLRKFKGKKKFFVLRKETEAGGPARLEYYANERKFKMGQPPKKSISLKACFNINQTDSKYKFAIALHTHNDCVRITMNSEEEMTEWLRLMNSMCEDEEEVDLSSSIGPAKPYFEHVWLVTALNKGLGSQEGILGSYRLCLTSKELTLLKVGDHAGRNAKMKFPLNVIRNVAHDKAYGCFFHIEFGRLACTGAGRLSLKTEDNNIAENIHLLLRKAWQNSAKDEFIPPRTRAWTYNDSSNSRSFHSTPPGMPRIPSVDGSLMSRIRTESISSSSTERRVSGMSPPSSSSIPIQSSPKSNSYSNTLCSTTDSASSSYSMDYENNNNHSNSGSGGGGGSSHAYSKSQDEDDSYVQWNPSDEHNLTLPLHPDHSDYVETSIRAVNGTPSSTADMQSPLSPFDNYIPMSPAGAISGGNGSARSGGKMSVSHSRNSSLIEDGYVPMLPGGHHSHSRSESGACSTAGSTTGLDEAYLEMDFPRKLDLSTDDMRRMSPASSESIQSGTPSSDYQLEKVSSYFQSDDFDDGSIAMRPTRAYSVGSRSDTSATGKSRFGKNRLEAVQETFRTRAMSVGSKQPSRKMINPSANTSSGLVSATGGNILSGIGPSRSGSIAPLSSSWSGSTGRWLPPKFLHPPTGQNAPIITTAYPSIHHQAQDSGDSDLMELDFSHNKQKSRKRSLPGPGGNLSSSSSTGSGATKLSPCTRTVLGSDTPPSIDTPDTPKSSFSANLSGNGIVPRYPTSAPISIQKNNKAFDCSGYMDSGNSILTRMTGYDLKKLKELDDDGAYLPMDFSAPAPAINGGHSAIQTTKSASSTRPPIEKPAKVDMPQVSTKPPTDKAGLYSTVMKSSSDSNEIGSKPVIVKANENIAAAKFTFSNSTGNNSNEPPSLSRSLSSSSNISTTSNNSNSSSTSCISVKSQQQAPLSPERSVSLTLNLPVSSPASSTPGSSTLSGSTSGVSSGAVTPTGSSSTLTRIEESPEKAQHAYFPMQPSQFANTPSALKKGCQEDGLVTYTPVYHFQPPTPIRRNLSFPSDIAGKISSSVAPPSSCSKQNQNSLLTTSTSKFSPLTSGPVNYAQVEFLKSSDEVKRN